MAASSNTLDSYESYKCENCKNVQRVSIEDFSNSDKIIDQDACNQLFEIYDSGPLGFVFGKLAFFQDNVTVGIECKKCQKNIDVSLLVKAWPVWDESRPDHCEPQIEYFTDLEILAVLPSDGSGHFETGFIDIDEYDPELDYDVYGDVYDPAELFDFSDIEITERPQSVISVNLQIIAKTAMNRGFCHLGFDPENRKIFRPFYRPEEGCCCWDEPLEIDKMYSFDILRSPDDSPSLTPFPHANEDLFIDHQSTEILQNVSIPNTFQNLQRIAKPSVEEIFGPVIRNHKYVAEGTNCPSVGVLRCRGRNVQILQNNNKKRTQLFGRYNFSITAVDEDIPMNLPDRDTLVILGLGRPWKGRENHPPFNPKRCYIIALRILQPDVN